MLRNPDLPWKTLANFSRTMARMLEAGVDVRKALKSAAVRGGDSRLEQALQQIRRSVAGGNSIADALTETGRLFPALFRDLVHVGELTGNLPDVFASLARYYETRMKQLTSLRSAIAWPIIQLVAAVSIIGLLIFILGLLPPAGDGRPFDVTGLGLAGTSGALTWLGGWAAAAVSGWVLWKYTRNNLVSQEAVDPLLLQIPVVGSCLRDFAVSRFAWCFSLTQKSGMSIKPSLECSLKAAENGAFTRAFPWIWSNLSEGDTLTDALAQSQLFSSEFIQFVATAEETGTVPEQLERMSHLFEEQAQRSMSRLTSVFTGAVWFMTAGLIVFFILRLAMIYVGLLNDAVEQAM
jgi:type IV pilus assembly protein PilC